eukprot:CAMPEP_0119418642 /NCGR_PEP_ID=MMETSP1335-20130426/18772_1 /TAXON_ID=259385 /ORGANISM="Chrysoculter rhomboideus, Strain RCC1486" /LENGTH=119 /DNA_ID=CAMNT_0007443901 /DNA_START=56 /DNA_END=412 /DNA_ORIENTATION=+
MGSVAFASAPVFKAIADVVKDPELAKKANGTFQFNITKGPGGATGSWVVDIKGGAVKEGKADKADVTMTLSDDDFVAMVSGKLAAQRAFMTGKLKISGNMGLAQKFSAVTNKLSNAGST